MTIAITLFEDHTWKGLRPLAAGLPTYEQRCGMFNTRERCEAIGLTGHLLCRPLLEPLHGEVSWTIGAADRPAAGGRAGGEPVGDRPPGSADAAAAGSGRRRRPGQSPSPGTTLTGWWRRSCRRSWSAQALAGWQAWRDGEQSRWPPGFRPGRGHLPGSARGAADLPCVGRSGSGGRVFASLEQAMWNANRPALRRSWDLVGGRRRRPALGSAERAGGRRLATASIRPDRRRGRRGAVEGAFAGRAPGQPDLPPGVWLLGDDLWCAGAVSFAPGAVVDTRGGPVIIDQGCEIASHTVLEGPLYLGPASRVKAGARIYGESSFGIGNRLAGEIGESTFGDFANKQHEGFIGHAACGSWTNLGALTTCSDLKNNYGERPGRPGRWS